MPPILGRERGVTSNLLVDFFTVESHHHEENIIARKQREKCFANKIRIIIIGKHMISSGVLEMADEITEEEFEKLEDVSKVIKVFENAAGKINKYNSYDRLCKGGRYNSAYHKVLNAATRKQSCLVNEDGTVDENSLRIIQESLVAFDMRAHGQMDDQFKDRLKEKLEKDKARALLRNFREFAILSPNIERIEFETKDFFGMMSERGNDSLSPRGNRFDVGATKIMNFLFPDLFVMVDRWVKKGLRKSTPLNPQKYWSIMMLCRKELEKWQTTYGDLHSLIALDYQPTTLTRVFDKCAFVMGKFKL